MPNPCSSGVSGRFSEPVKMAGRVARALVAMLAVSGFAAISVPMGAQSAWPASASSSAMDPAIRRNVENWLLQGRGVADDWSHHRLLFSNAGTEQEALASGTFEHWVKVSNEHRYTMQVVKRSMNAAAGSGEGSGSSTPGVKAAASTIGRPGLGAPPSGKKLGKDWSMDLGGGTASSLTGTVSSNGATSSSTVTVDGVTLDAGAPTDATATGTISANNASGSSTVTVDGVTIDASSPTTASGAASINNSTFSVTGGTSTVTIDGQPLTASAPTDAVGTVTFSSACVKSTNTITINSHALTPGGGTGGATLGSGSVAVTSNLPASISLGPVTYNFSNSSGNTTCSGAANPTPSATNVCVYTYSGTNSGTKDDELAVNLASAITNGTVACSAANNTPTGGHATCFNMGASPAANPNFSATATGSSTTVSLTQSCLGAYAVTTSTGVTDSWITGTSGSNNTYPNFALAAATGTAPTDTSMATQMYSMINAGTNKATLGLSAVSNPSAGVVQVTTSTAGTSGLSSFSNTVYAGVTEAITTPGTWGLDSGTTFSYYTSGGVLDNAVQLASSIAAAINNNLTLGPLVTAVAGSSGSNGTIALTADTGGSSGNYTTTAALTGFSWTNGATMTGGGDGVTSGTSTPPTFAYWSGAAAATPTQVATNIATAINNNTTLKTVATGVSASSTAGAVTVTARTAGPGGNSYGVGVSNFAGFSWSPSADLSGGSDGVTSGTTFAYSGLTATQLAANLAAAINANPTLQVPSTGVTATSNGGTVTVTGRAPGAGSYGTATASLPGFGWGTGGVFAAGTANGAMTGAVGAGMYPAKYSFNTDATSPACADAPQPDFIVYNTAVAGSATQASVVAYDNLYVNSGGTGQCAGATTPSVYFAYNTGGTILTSPAFWYDGSQVAFVHSTSSGAASLVVLKWAPSATARALTVNAGSGSTAFTVTSGTLATTDVGAQVSGTGIPANDTIASVNTVANTGTLASAATSGAGSGETLSVYAETPFTPGVPPSVTPANYAACTAPCMTSVAFSDANPDTNSAPFVDYGTGTVYVGDNSGYLHKFVFAFENPTEASGWPIHVSTNKLTSPVYDSSSSPTQVFVADSGGFLYSLNASTGVLYAKSSQLSLTGSAGIVDAPIIDPTAGAAYVFVGDDASTTSNNVNCQSSAGCEGVFRFPLASFNTTGTGTCTAGTGTPTSWATGTLCGAESVFGVGSTGTNLFDGAFDNTYYSGSGNTGNIWSCPQVATTGAKLDSVSLATLTTTAVQFRAANVINPITTAAATCSPVTEIYNGTNDWIFMSVSANGNQSASGCSGSGTAGACLYNFNVSSTPTAATAGISTDAGSSGLGGSSSGIIIDNTSSDTGASQIYYAPLGNQSCTTSGGTGGCAVQTSQAAP